VDEIFYAFRGDSNNATSSLRKKSLSPPILGGAAVYRRDSGLVFILGF